MNSKFIIIKINSENFYNLLVSKLTEYNHIHFISKKINGLYTIAVKCNNFYNKFLDYYTNDNIYTSYIYLYTNISIILSELIIEF